MVEAAGRPGSGSTVVQVVPTSSHHYEFVLVNAKGQRVPANEAKRVAWNGQTKTLNFSQGISKQKWNHMLWYDSGKAALNAQ